MTKHKYPVGTMLIWTTRGKRPVVREIVDHQRAGSYGWRYPFRDGDGENYFRSLDSSDPRFEAGWREATPAEVEMERGRCAAWGVNMLALQLAGNWPISLEMFRAMEARTVEELAGRRSLPAE